jgi:hypothetical protein
MAGVIDDHINYRWWHHEHGKTSAGMLSQIIRVSMFWRHYAELDWMQRAAAFKAEVQKGLLFLTFDTTQTPFYLSARAKKFRANLA